MVIEKIVGPAAMEACDSLEVKEEHDPLELDNKILEVKKEIGEPQLETKGKNILVHICFIFDFSCATVKIFYLIAITFILHTSLILLSKLT